MKKQAAKQRKKLNEQKRGNRDREDRTKYMSTYDANRDREDREDRTEYMSTYNAKRKTETAAYDAARNAKHKRVRTQAEKDKAKENQKKKRATSNDKGSKILVRQITAINNN